MTIDEATKALIDVGALLLDVAEPLRDQGWEPASRKTVQLAKQADALLADVIAARNADRAETCDALLEELAEEEASE